MKIDERELFKREITDFILEEDPMLAVLKWTTTQLMEAAGANKNEHSTSRTTHFSGYRPRRFDTRTGTMYPANGRVVSTAIMIAYGVGMDGKREVLAIEPFYSESNESWGAFFSKLKQIWTQPDFKSAMAMSNLIVDEYNSKYPDAIS